MEKEKEEEEVVCDKHPEVPYWFCEDEQRAVCPVCVLSLHQSRKVVPVEQAVRDLKDHLKSDCLYRTRGTNTPSLIAMRKYAIIFITCHEENIACSLICT